MNKMNIMRDNPFDFYWECPDCGIIITEVPTIDNDTTDHECN